MSDCIMNSHETINREQELKSAIMDELEDAGDEYLESFRLKSNDGKTLPSINELEDIVADLRTKTRDIYLKMVSESITSFDESELIDSKKDSTGKEG